MADISFACPNCNQVLEAPEDWAGQTVECPSCNTPIEVPTAVVETPAAPAADAVAAACAECGAALAAGAVLCLQCGYHHVLKKKITTDFS